MTKDSDIDGKILALLKDNKTGALNLMYDHYYYSVIKIAFKITHDQDVAKDIAQDLFLNIWVKRHQLSIQKPIKFYLVRSVINRCMNYLRDGYKPNRSSINITTRVNDNLGEESLRYEDLKRLVEASLDMLPPKCKLIFGLSRWQGMSNAEISSHLGISIKAVEKQITKALKHLRNNIKPYLSSLFCLIAS